MGRSHFGTTPPPPPPHPAKIDMCAPVRSHCAVYSDRIGFYWNSEIYSDYTMANPHPTLHRLPLPNTHSTHTQRHTPKPKPCAAVQLTFFPNSFSSASNDCCDSELVMFAVSTEKAIIPMIIHSILNRRAGTDLGAVSPYLQKKENQKPIFKLIGFYFILF